ncbi:hypothetical protein V8C35DRAFT_322959 [Trichoderma chlorosporum]
MNSIPPDVIASSVPFRFLVGPNKREFIIHSALFTHQSPVLERLANGNFAEAAEKCVRWKSVDEDTFISAAPPVKLDSKSDASLEPSQLQSSALFNAPPPQHAGLFGRPLPPQPQHTGMSAVQRPDVILNLLLHNQPPTPEELKRKALWDAFKKQQFIDSSPSFTTLQTACNGPVTRDTSVLHNQANEDYTDTFLSHVRLYIFAECYAITVLMGHSLTQLHSLLEGFTLHENRIDDIVALIRYCYENLAPESLRSLVTLYAACKMDKLWKNKQFQALVAAHSELSMALLGLMVNKA